MQATQSVIDPQAIAIDSAGNIYFEQNGFDLGNGNYISASIRKVDAQNGLISIIAGLNQSPGFSGDGGPALIAQFFRRFASALTVDGAGNVFIGDSSNSRVRRIDAVTKIITTVAGGGTVLGDGGPATSTLLNGISDLAVDAAGNL